MEIKSKGGFLIMNEFENRRIKGIRASRYIASWVNEGGSLNAAWDKETDDICYPFEEWLKSIRFEEADGTISYMSDDDAAFIRNMATNGKLELEMQAKDFIKERKKTLEY